MKEICYINLTAGIEAIPKLPLGYRFIRIQSTLCEVKCWDKLIRDLDYDFLMNLALGNQCLVYDYSPKKQVSRALYQGLEFVKYVLARRWFKKAQKAFVKGINVSYYFDQEYDKLSRAAIAKVNYFKKFLKTDKLHLESICHPTPHDSDFSFYNSILDDVVKKT